VTRENIRKAGKIRRRGQISGGKKKEEEGGERPNSFPTPLAKKEDGRAEKRQEKSRVDYPFTSALRKEGGAQRIQLTPSQFPEGRTRGEEEERKKRMNQRSASPAQFSNQKRKISQRKINSILPSKIIEKKRSRENQEGEKLFRFFKKKRVRG